MIRALISTLFCLLFTVSSYAQTLTIAQDPWPPFVDEDAAGQGLSIEIVRAALEPKGYQIKMNFVPWARALNGVKNAQYDVLASAWFTQERSEYLAFSDDYLSNEIKFIMRSKDSFQYNGIDSLTGKNIGVVRGYGYGDEFLNATNFKRHETKDLVSNVKKLVAGRIDLTLEDELVAKSLLAKEAPEMLGKITFVTNPLSTKPMHIAVGKKNPKHQQIIQDFNQGLKEIKASGKFQELVNKYIK